MTDPLSPSPPRASPALFDDLDIRRRRIRVRAWRRGMREMDIVLGTFADACVDQLGAVELDALEALLDAPDDKAFAWFCGAEATPQEYQTPLFARLRAFHDHAKPLHD